ncbi:MAG: glycosyltransferase [Candidatus Azobacteroides sp.]|nr:glycosyltransferase [Candidatus Azobacteroides sp.]
MRVTVSVTNDLVTDQRVHKVCTTLMQNGYEVKLIGRELPQSKPIERSYLTERMSLLFYRTLFFYAEFNIRLFFYLLFDKTDIFLSNDTDTLLANYFASVIRRKPLVFDAHEIFPEAPEITDRKWVKKVWTTIEDYIFPRLKNTYTVCDSISAYYFRKYNLNMQVVRNIPLKKVKPLHPARLSLTDSPIDAKGKKVILYQGAVNRGRGIEWMIDTMPYLDNFVFYIVGDGDKLKELKEKVTKAHLSDKVIFTGQIPFENLSAYTARADIGINLLENWGLSYYYSLPNRIFDYIREEVPILASDFPEIHKIITQYNIGILINNFDPQYIASIVKRMALRGRNRSSFAAANEELCWENETPVLLNVMKDATG